jgi:uncharacterized protein
MLLLLSPAKTLDYETPAPPALPHTRPAFVAESRQLIDLLRTRGVGEIAALMDLSETLSSLNVGRYQAWSPRFTAANSKQAVLAFAGDVYDGLQAASLSPDDLAWAQDHVAILSGLYGVLRPLDRLQPYRLEMGTRLPNARGKDLYAFWGDRIARHLDRQLAAEKSPLIVNLASEEYFKAVDRRALRARVVHCVFEDWQGGRFRVISFHAKRARGLMARHAIRHRARGLAALQGFDAAGYAFAADASTPDRLVFRRRTPTAPLP